MNANLVEIGTPQHLVNPIFEKLTLNNLLNKVIFYLYRAFLGSVFKFGLKGADKGTSLKCLE